MGEISTLLQGVPSASGQILPAPGTRLLHLTGPTPPRCAVPPRVCETGNLPAGPGGRGGRNGSV